MCNEPNFHPDEVLRLLLDEPVDCPHRSARYLKKIDIVALSKC